MKIGQGVSELWGVENRPLPLTRPMAYTTACTTVQAVIMQCKHASSFLYRYNLVLASHHLLLTEVWRIEWYRLIDVCRTFPLPYLCLCYGNWWCRYGCVCVCDLFRYDSSLSLMPVDLMTSNAASELTELCVSNGALKLTCPSSSSSERITCRVWALVGQLAKSCFPRRWVALLEWSACWWCQSLFFICVDVGDWHTDLSVQTFTPRGPRVDGTVAYIVWFHFTSVFSRSEFLVTCVSLGAVE